LETKERSCVARPRIEFRPAVDGQRRLQALGTAETLFDNAAVSILPSVVPKEQLARANGRLLASRW
jgi:hypothetical protein